MALPYDWDIATVEEVMKYYADVDGVDLPNLTDRLGDENAPVPVRVDKFLDYNGTWVEKKYYPVEALKVLLWKEPLVAASDLENWLDMPREEIEKLHKYEFCRPVGINKKGEWIFDADYMLKCRKAWKSEQEGGDTREAQQMTARPREAESNWFSLDFRARPYDSVPEEA